MVTQTRGLFEKYTDPAQFARIIEMDTVTEMWRRCQAEFPEAEAIVDNGVSYTFARLESDAAGFRTVLAESAPGSRVALFAANSYDFVKAYLATVTSGRTAVIFPAQLDAASVFGCCMMFGVSTLVYQPDFADRVALAEQRIPGLRLIPADTLSDEKTPMADCTGDTPCCIVFTGGTTGRSKGALLSHEAVMQGTVNGCYGYQDVFSQRYLLILPLSHVFGLIRNLMTSLYTGSTLFICRSNKDMFRDIAVFRPTILVMVPALAEMALTLSKKFGRNMLGADLKYIICGAAAVSPYLVGEYHKLGITLCPGYGLTESANLVSGNPESLSKPDSVGIPYPNQELRVVNGELWLKGRNMMTGIDEGWSVDDRIDMAMRSEALMKKLGCENVRIAVMSGGRDEDLGRLDVVDESITDAIEIVKRLNKKGYDAYDAQILLEDAVEEADLIIAPNGITGNLIFRTMHFLGNAPAFGAPLINSDKVFVDTSRVKTDFTDCIILAMKLVGMKQ